MAAYRLLVIIFDLLSHILLTGGFGENDYRKGKSIISIEFFDSLVIAYYPGHFYSPFS